MGLLAVVGHTTRDLVDSRPPRPGGAPLLAARALRALGEPAVVVTRCAEADRGLLEPLRATGLPVVWRPEAQAAVFRLADRGGGGGGSGGRPRPRAGGAARRSPRRTGSTPGRCGAATSPRRRSQSSGAAAGSPSTGRGSGGRAG